MTNERLRQMYEELHYAARNTANILDHKLTEEEAHAAAVDRVNWLHAEVDRQHALLKRHAGVPAPPVVAVIREEGRSESAAEIARVRAENAALKARLDASTRYATPEESAAIGRGCSVCGWIMIADTEDWPHPMCDDHAKAYAMGRAQGTAGALEDNVIPMRPPIDEALLSLPECPERDCDICGCPTRGEGFGWWTQGIGCNRCTEMESPSPWFLEPDAPARYWRQRTLALEDSVATLRHALSLCCGGLWDDAAKVLGPLP